MKPFPGTSDEVEQRAGHWEINRKSTSPLQLFIGIFFDPVSLPIKHTYSWTNVNDINVMPVPMIFDSVI